MIDGVEDQPLRASRGQAEWHGKKLRATGERRNDVWFTVEYILDPREGGMCSAVVRCTAAPEWASRDVFLEGDFYEDHVATPDRATWEAVEEDVERFLREARETVERLRLLFTTIPAGREVVLHVGDPTDG